MRISDLLSRGEQFFSLEFFPPKERADWPAFFQVVERLKAVNPLFVSVTYGAGGSTQSHTLEIVTRLKGEYGLEPMAHLTCVGASVAGIGDFLHQLASAGIDNVLALRGDPPQGDSEFRADSEDFQHASDLVRFIRERHPQMGVGVAGYPEGHPESTDREADLAFLKAKLDLGGDFIVSQLFFDNEYYWDFVRRARGAGISKPIIPGVLPIFSITVLKKIASLCNATIPAQLLAELEDAQNSGGVEAVQALGIAHAQMQIQGLLDGGAPGVHLYTLNKAEACLELVQGVSLNS